MEKYRINGGKRLHGEVEINGAKNAAVGIIPAALLVNGVCRIENVPEISDTETLLQILRSLGAEVKMITPSTVEIDCRHVTWQNADYDRMMKIRASYYFIGSMLGRFGIAQTTMPGGCNFGVRPIDQHVKGMTALGAPVDVRNGFIFAEATAEDHRLHGAEIYLDKVSVGATINIILAACMAEGKTVIENCAREPHIVDVANFLNSMGADIRGAGTDTIKINGVDSLHGGTYTIIPDQIEAATYMIMAAGTGGEVLVKNVIPKHLDIISAKLREMGVVIEEYPDSLLVRSSGQLKHTNVKTQPYPGFPTDAQPQMGAIFTRASGASMIIEDVYDGNRYKYVNELCKMGAHIRVEGKVAFFEGSDTLTGANVKSCDLRAGAAMVIAALSAQGTTWLEEVHYIERGYQDFVQKLRLLGADIELVELPDEDAPCDESVG